MKAKVKALTLQKLESTGLTAARTISALLTKVIETPLEPKFRRVPWFAGKPAYMRIAPATGALALLMSLGWVKETAEDGTVSLALPESAPLEAIKATVAEIKAAEDGGLF